MSRTKGGSKLTIAVVALVVSGAAACGGASDRSSAPVTSVTPSTAAVTPTSAGAATSRPATSEPVTTTTGPTTTEPVTTTTEPRTTTTATTSPVTTTTTTAPAVPGVPPGLTRESGDLAQGSKGTRTFLLQRKLHELAYDVGEPDGAFGTKTAMAVWAYQGLHGLQQDGVVKPLVELAIQADTRGTQKMLRPDLGPDHSEVDLDRQVLLVFRGGALQLVTHVSTGSGRHYCDMGHCGTAVTPTGDYRYQRRISGWRVAPLGRLYNPVYFNGGIAVHGAPSVPDHPASHGCVRIPMHIAEYFPDLVANGDPISVFRGGTGSTV